MTIQELAQYIHENKTDVIFDFDCTIARIDIDWTEWHAGMEKVYQEFEPAFDKSNHNNFVANLQHEFITKYGEPLRAKANTFNGQYERENKKGYIVVPQTHALLEQLNGVNLYIWTSNARETALQGLEELGIRDRFKAIAAKDDVFLPKPATDGFTLLDIQQEDLDKILFIGDSDFSDGGAAKNLGIEFINVATIEA